MDGPNVDAAFPRSCFPPNFCKFPKKRVPITFLHDFPAAKNGIMIAVVYQNVSPRLTS